MIHINQAFLIENINKVDIPAEMNLEIRFLNYFLLIPICFKLKTYLNLKNNA